MAELKVSQRARELLLAELNPAHAEQVRKGNRTVETSMVDGAAVLRAIEAALTDAGCVQPQPQHSAPDLEAWIADNFGGHGIAIRRKEDPPIPGEPLMSMAIAKDLARKAFERGSILATRPATSPITGEAREEVGHSERLGYERRVLAAECGTQRILNDLKDRLTFSLRQAEGNRDAFDMPAARLLANIIGWVNEIDVVRDTDSTAAMLDEAAVRHWSERGAQAALDAGLAENGGHGVAAARHAVRTVLTEIAAVPILRSHLTHAGEPTEPGPLPTQGERP